MTYPLPIPPKPPLGIDDLVLLGVSGATSLITLCAAIRLRRSSRELRVPISYGGLIGKGIKDISGSYLNALKSKKFKVVLSDLVIDEPFTGAWECIKLGSGGWGSAYLLMRNKKYLVIKVPHGFESIIEHGDIPTVNERLLNQVSEEAEILSKLEHPHILKLLGYSRRVPLLIYEFANYGTIEWQINNGWSPSIKDVLLIGTQLADALRYIHSRGLIHGDIKAGNIFIVNGVVKLGDFSSIVKLLAVTSSKSKWSYTPGWRAPEQVYSDLMRKVSKRGLEDRIDVYQLGNLILYLVTGRVVDGEDIIKEGVLEEVINHVGHRDLRELIKNLLAPEPEDRLSASEVAREFYKLYLREP